MNTPIWILGLSHSLASDGILENLTSVDLFLNTAAGDQSVDDHVFLLSNTEGSVHSLSICCRVPAGINCRKEQIITSRRSSEEGVQYERAHK